MSHKATPHKAMRHEAFPLAFNYLWTLIRGPAVARPRASSQDSAARQTDAARERDPQPLRLLPF
jgi:hypothetical protein